MTANLQGRQRNDGHPKAVATLDREDRQHLLMFERRCDYLRDRTRSVAEGYQNGAYIVGRPGSGKTFVVKQTLEETEAHYLYKNGHMRPMGLYEELAAHREHVVILDDLSLGIADIVASRQGQGPSGRLC